MTVLVANVQKWDKGEKSLRVTYVGLDRETLENKIKETYKLELVKDEHDNFPWFTDGGFKYWDRNETFMFEITCSPYTVIE